MFAFVASAGSMSSLQRHPVPLAAAPHSTQAAHSSQVVENAYVWSPPLKASIVSCALAFVFRHARGRKSSLGSVLTSRKSSRLLCRAASRDPRAGPARDQAESNVPLLQLGEDEPGNAWDMGSRTFKRELGQLLQAMKTVPLLHGLAAWVQESTGNIVPRPPPTPPPFTKKLTLDVDAIQQREVARGVPESSLPVQVIFFALCWTLDRLYEGRPIQKFWVLETVARLPYFSYITVLHLYESLGWWRTPQLRAIHNAEEDNELHHLLIMEALGGGCAWFDRFVAQHAALTYYWAVVVLFMAQPSLAYNFSLLVEEHAYVTYAQFVEENAEVLKKVPAPPIAAQYYKDGDLYLFDKFHTGEPTEPVRRPPCENLLDVFTNIRDDELEHVRTMKACQQWWEGDGDSAIPPIKSEAAANRGEWQRWSHAVNKHCHEVLDAAAVASAAVDDQSATAAKSSSSMYQAPQRAR
mmetsp:Transcript_15812/g.37216  ORF Transcript_15812/g.37216 Transcript_15812/m.37216 type:complete len:466 (+) Transcript_15812:57-1454(+)